MFFVKQPQLPKSVFTCDIRRIISSYILRLVCFHVLPLLILVPFVVFSKLFFYQTHNTPMSLAPRKYPCRSVPSVFFTNLCTAFQE